MQYEQGPQRATRREWTGLAILALPCLLYSMDLTVLNLAVPQLTAELRPSAAQLLWIVDIYGFLLAGCLITMGTLGDRIGRRRLLLCGAAAFGAASVLAAFSTSASMLIVARALMGIAGATLAPSTLSLLRNMFHDPRQRTFAIGVWIASFSAGGALGPLFGGVLLEYFRWGAVFLANVPVMLLLLALAPRLLPEYRDPGAGRLDVAGAAMSLVAVLAVIYGLKRLAGDGFGWVPPFAILGGLTVGVVFLRRQRTHPAPLIDLGLFRQRAFAVSLAVNVAGFFVAFAVFLLVAQVLQLVLGMGPLRAGLWTASSGLAFIVGAMAAPALVRRVHPAWVVAAGFALAAIGLAVCAGFEAGHGPLRLVAGYVLLSLGLAPVFTLATDLIVGSAPAARAGMASALSETSSEFGGALGIALLGSLVAALYRTGMAPALDGVLVGTAAAVARDTLGGAVDVARELPAAAASATLEMARAAFLAAFRAVAWVGVAVTLTASVLTVLVLRRIDAGPDPTPLAPEAATPPAG